MHIATPTDRQRKGPRSPRQSLSPYFVEEVAMTRSDFCVRVTSRVRPVERGSNRLARHLEVLLGGKRG